MQEEWRPVKGYEGSYEVSSRGRVRSVPRNVKYPIGKTWHFKGKILSLIPSRKDWRGYDRVRLYKNGKYNSLFVHRLVAEAFIPNPENKREVNHLDGNRHNNYLENLEWATSSENIGHRIYTLNRGTNNNMQIVPVRCIETRQAFRSLSEAARWCGGTPHQVWRSTQGMGEAQGYHFCRLYQQVSKEWISELEKEIARGYVRLAQHPTLPLRIYNYTKKCQFENNWNDVTTRTRGLILDDKDNIIVDPPKKFFNHDETYAPKFSIEKALIFDKADGFMIIVKNDPLYGLIITSRGSFDNKYIDAAKDLLPDNIYDLLIPDYSYFCELCQDFPEDRGIIVAKHPVPKLLCWAIRTQDGQELSLSLSPFETVQQIPYPNLENYLTTKTEGVVAFDPSTGNRVKIKTAWWFDMHRKISGITPQRAFEAFSNGQTIEDFTQDLPEELIPEAKKYYSEIKNLYDLMFQHLYKMAENYKHLTNKELALSDEFSPFDKNCLLLLRHNKQEKIRTLILRAIRPKSGIIDTRSLET